MANFVRPIVAPLGASRTGLAGTTLGYTVTSSTGATLQARTTAGVSETGIIGTYTAFPIFSDAWVGTVMWDISGTPGVGYVEGFAPASPTYSLATVQAYTAGANPVTLLTSSGTPIAVDSLGRMTVGSNTDKAGYALATTGLDAISVADVISVADAKSTFPKILRALYDRQFNAVSQTATSLTVGTDSGTTWATMPVSDNGVQSVKGSAS